jgi:hypothetical protein
MKLELNQVNRLGCVSETTDAITTRLGGRPRLCNRPSSASWLGSVEGSDVEGTAGREAARLLWSERRNIVAIT